MSGAESFTVGFGDSNRNSSRVLNPPGGVSSDIFGTNSLAHGSRSRNLAHLQSSFSFGDAGLGEGGRERGTPMGTGVYDVFPEKSKRSTPCHQKTSERLSTAGTEEGTADSIKTGEDSIEDMQGEGGQIGYSMDEENLPPIHSAQSREDIHAIPDKVPSSNDHATGNIQLPRKGSRNPITGYGIGEDDTREICSIGCDSHNDTSSSGRNTGKRMYNTYNQRSQQW